MTGSSYRSDILSLFLKALERDRDKYIREWMVQWAYQDRRHTRYRQELPQDFYTFDGPADLVKWFNWVSSTPRPSFVDAGTLTPLIQASRSVDERVFSAIDLDFPCDDTYEATIGSTNAQDFYFPQSYPQPARHSVKTVLDFGAGYGRQANLWLQERPDVTYVAVDGIPLSYCLQHLYYSYLNADFYDYVVDGADRTPPLDKPGICHLPTWRLDLLPDDTFDLVSCVQVLPELGSKLLVHTLRTIRRILKPGGALYLRDHDRQWRPGHILNTNRLLAKLGFELEFHPHVIDREDVWGVPRVWRKVDPRVIESRRYVAETILNDWGRRIDHLTGGRLRRLVRRVRGSSSPDNVSA